MKKRIIPCLFSLFLLASCGTKDCEKHDYGDWTVTKETKCGEAGSKERTCKACGNKDTATIVALEHDFRTAADQTGAVAATCKQKGTTITECSKCGAKSTAEVPMVSAHNFVDATDQTGAKATTCKEAGTAITECTICGEKSTRVINKTEDHTFGDWETVTPATHAAKGSKKRTCSVCNKVETADIDKLAEHEFGETAIHVDADHDLIAYDIYTCATENARKIIWNANDVSDDTKNKKYNNEDNYKIKNGGVMFGERPIGNSMNLPASQPNGGVYNEDVPGAFLEYTINLKTAMVGAQLIADMTPGQWLSQTGGLFMSDASADWTVGFTGENQICDFRYVIEVNGKEVTLDASKNIAANEATQRGWYNFPCTVDLKAGVNTIRLIKAGGWDATYYNFGVISAEGIENVIPDVSQGYEVKFEKDEHVKSITVYEDKACTVEDVGPAFYSRIDTGRKSDGGDGQISFAVEVDEGYQVKEIKQILPEGKTVYKNIKSPADTAADCGKDNVYRITKIEDNCTFSITTEEADVVYDGNKITFVLGEHVTGLEIYESKTYAAETKIEGLVAFALNEKTLKPTFEEGQVYMKIFFEEGYVIDSDAMATLLGDDIPYNKVKGPEDTKDPDGYRLTKVTKSGTVTILAKAAA